MKLASMAGMQVDPVPEESAKSLEEINGFEPAVIPVQQADLRSDLTQDKEFRQLERVVQMFGRKKQKAKYTLQGRAHSAYAEQVLNIEQPEIIGTKFNKAS